MVLLLDLPTTLSQITFSKDWRAGGKRSSQASSAVSSQRIWSMIPSWPDMLVNCDDYYHNTQIEKIHELIRVNYYLID